MFAESFLTHAGSGVMGSGLVLRTLPRMAQVVGNRAETVLKFRSS